MRALKEIRESKGISQEDLSKSSGVSRQTISRIEAGENIVVTTKTLSLLAKALGVNVQDIFFTNDV